MNTCIHCNLLKTKSDFPSYSGRHSNICRNCQSKERKQRKHTNGQMTKKQRNEYMRKYRIANAEKILAKQLAQRKTNPLIRLWKQLTTRKEVLAISREDFMTLEVPETCPVLGIPIGYDGTRDNFPSVDRINPNKPYELGNIAIISFRANMIKSVGSKEEHMKIVEWLDKFPDFDGKPLNWTQKVGASSVYFGKDHIKLENVSPVCISV